MRIDTIVVSTHDDFVYGMCYRYGIYMEKMEDSFFFFWFKRMMLMKEGRMYDM